MEKLTAQWIWYPGDFEIDLHHRISARRTQRGIPVLPHWRLDNFCPSATFTKRFTLARPETLTVKADGLLMLYLTGRDGSDYVYHFDGELSLAAGGYELSASVYNNARVPSLYVAGKTVVSDGTWEVSCNDMRSQPAAAEGFTDPESPPGTFRLPSKPGAFAGAEKIGKGILYDFGCETVAFLRFEGIAARGRINICYGESREEALDALHSEVTESLTAGEDGTAATVTARAFRYVFVSGAAYRQVTPSEECADIANKASFDSADGFMNRIYAVSARTFLLCAREFFLDGVKRDRWVWSGDAYQSYLMNFYSFWDIPTAKRTALALFGKAPVATFINHIMDYTLYWVIAFEDYHAYTGDAAFVVQCYPKILASMRFCETRLNEDGFLEGQGKDWVFIDWANLDNRGAVCAEQILYCRALSAAAFAAGLAGDGANAARFKRAARTLKKAIDAFFWDDALRAYHHSVKDGKRDGVVTRHAAVLAVFFNICLPERLEDIKTHTLLSVAVPAITTPYMRFYELSALAMLGETAAVYAEIKRYWGGMLEAGATSFWETFDPQETGAERYAMYGRAYGKSLCHAWGAGPLYLLMRHMLGVRPLKPGYALFEAKPDLASLGDFACTVPLGCGRLDMACKDGVLTVFSDRDGRIVLPSPRGTVCRNIRAGVKRLIQIAL